MRCKKPPPPFKLLDKAGGRSAGWVDGGGEEPGKKVGYTYTTFTPDEHMELSGDN